MELLQVFTGLRRMATTNGAGIYRFEAVDLGAHELKIAHAGFKSFEASGLSVEANRTAVVDIELELGSEAVTIQVGAASGMIAKDGPLRGGNFSATQVSQLPLTGLNPLSLARTLLGVIRPSCGTVGEGGGEAVDFAVNGQRVRGNNSCWMEPRTTISVLLAWRSPSTSQMPSKRCLFKPRTLVSSSGAPPVGF